MPPSVKKDFYCGKAKRVPKEYHRSGTKYECLKRGIGVGINKRYDDEKDEDLSIRQKRRRKIELDSIFRSLAMLLQIDD